MARLDFEDIAESAARFMEDMVTPERVLLEPENGDMGGFLGMHLAGYTIEISPLEYDIIVLKCYNIMMEKQKVCCPGNCSSESCCHHSKPHIKTDSCDKLCCETGAGVCR